MNLNKLQPSILALKYSRWFCAQRKISQTSHYRFFRVIEWDVSLSAVNTYCEYFSSENRNDVYGIVYRSSEPLHESRISHEVNNDTFRVLLFQITRLRAVAVRCSFPIFRKFAMMKSIGMTTLWHPQICGWWINTEWVKLNISFIQMTFAKYLNIIAWVKVSFLARKSSSHYCKTVLNCHCHNNMMLTSAI